MQACSLFTMAQTLACHCWQFPTQHEWQTVQDYVCSMANLKDWDIIAIQEPWLDPVGNSCGTQYWCIVYPANFYVQGCSRICSILLIKAKISTDCYLVIPIQHSNITAVQFSGNYRNLSILNIYNEITNNDHMLWLGDFNQSIEHHPLWEDKGNEHLYESEDNISPLIELLYKHNMLLTLTKGIPTFQTCTGFLCFQKYYIFFHQIW